MATQAWPDWPEMRQPVSVGALFRLGWGIFVRGAAWIVAPHLAPGVVGELIGRRVGFRGPGVLPPGAGGPEDLEALMAVLPGVLFYVVGTGLLFLLAQLVSTRAALVAAAGRRPDWAAVRGVVTLGWWLRILGLTLLAGLGAFLGLLVLVLPGVWLLVRWSLAQPALVAEGGGAVRALGRSARLVDGRWWTLFGLHVVYGLVSFLAGLAVAWAAPLAVLVNAALAGLWVALLVAAYLRRRGDLEGYTAQALAGDLGLTGS